MAFLPPGLHLGVPHDAYHADPSERPSLSSHAANTLVSRSAGHAHAEHPRFGGKVRKRTDIMDTGTLLHDFVLGGEVGFVEVAHDDWRTNDAKAQRAKAWEEGKVAVLSEKMQVLQEAAGRVKDILPSILPHAITMTKTEVTALWESNGCPCRCRIDDLEPDFWIWDLKFVDDATVSAADRNIAGSGYHVQAAANIDAIESLIPEAAGRVHFGLCFVEWENPAIGIMRREVRGQLLDVGQKRWARAKAIWGQCLSTNSFPGYSTEITEAQCPPWVAGDELQTQMMPSRHFRKGDTCQPGRSATSQR